MKAMYKQTNEGMQEKIASSQEEVWSMVKEGWHLHPQEARQSPEVETKIEEEPEEKRKPGRPRK